MGTFGSLTPLFEKPISENTQSIFGSLIKSTDPVYAPVKQPSCTEIFGELHFKERGEPPQLCTEGLGLESSDDTVAEGELGEQGEKKGVGRTRVGRGRNERASSRGFPPPIPSIGRSGKPSIAFESFKGEGRFVLRQVKVPSKELFLRACREGGRLMLHLVQSEENYDGGVKEEEEQQEEVRGDDSEEVELHGKK